MTNEYCIYLRKSRGDAALEAMGVDILERHELTLLNLAKQMNLSITAIYREVVSGDSISARPEMQKLLSEVESGKWKGVLVMEVERLARGDTIDQGIVQRAFQYTDTLIVTPVKVYDPSNEFDEEYFVFGLFMSRREYKTIKRRMQAGRYAAAREGKWPFNAAPYGFRRLKLPKEKGWTLELDEAEAPTVRLVFSMFTGPDRTGVVYIRRYLNDHQMFTRSGKFWTDEMVRSLLSNPVYDQQVAIGRRKQVAVLENGVPMKKRPRSNDYEIYPGRQPRLIDHDVWAEAQSYLGKGKPKLPEQYSVKNPLAGLVICSECKKKMLRRPAAPPGNKYGAHYDSILCNTQNCPTVGCSLDLLERSVIDALSEWVKNYELDNVIPESKVPELTNLLDGTQQEKASLLSQKENLFDLLEQGVYSSDVFLERSHVLQERINAIDDKILDLQKEIKYEQNNDAHIHNFIPSCKGLLSCYWELSAIDRNKALKMLLDGVEYKKLKKNERGHKNDASFELTLKPRIPRI